ncbi:MAG: tryptophan synthase subunit alpha [Rubricoccaceae bacterium]
MSTPPPPANRLRSRLDALRARGEKALGLFLTSGFPAPGATLPILEAVDAAGADFVELGMPFSDPVAEGLPIQMASERALRQGATMETTFRTAEAFRARSETPLVLMGYANPVFRYGVRAFCRAAAAAGADGLILPDVPPEEAEELEDEAAAHGLAVTHLVAPNTSDARVRLVGQRATGFVYAVSRAGLTGTALADAAVTAAYLARVRALVPERPLLVGFGIATPDDAARLARGTDGVIVGSALIRLAEQLFDAPEFTDSQRLDRLSAFARSLKRGAAAAR